MASATDQPRPMQGIKRQHSFSQDDDQDAQRASEKRMRLDSTGPTLATRQEGIATWLEATTRGADEYTPDPRHQADMQSIATQPHTQHHDSDARQGEHIRPSASPITPYRKDHNTHTTNFARQHTPSSWFPTPRNAGLDGPEHQQQQADPEIVHDPADHPQYREVNLRAHKIFLQGVREPLPEHVANLVYQVQHSSSSNSNSNNNNGSIGPSSRDPTTSEIEADTVLQNLSLGQTTKPMIARIFTQRILPRRHPFDVYSRTFCAPFARWTEPDPGESLDSVDLQMLAIPLGTSAPDILYGYDLQNSFSHAQRCFLQGRDLEGELQVPFLVIECVGDQYGPEGGGSMFTATNRCLRNAAACVDIAGNLIEEARGHHDQSAAHWQGIDSQVFSVATNGTEARLYVSWRPEGDSEVVNTAIVKCFLLQDAQHYLELRKVVRGIIDWGKGRRLEQLRFALDFMSQRTGYDRNKSEDMDSLM